MKSVIGEQCGVGVVEDTENSTIIVWFISHNLYDSKSGCSVEKKIGNLQPNKRDAEDELMG
jgi:hypothetical protein